MPRMSRMKLAEEALERQRRHLAPSPLKETYFSPFPLRLALLQSLNQQVGRSRRIRASWPRHNHAAADHRLREARRHFGTVQIARNGMGWWLAYDGAPRSGPFASRADAIAWFKGHGR